MKLHAFVVILAMQSLFGAVITRAAFPGQKDYLSTIEANKIRDAATSSVGIRICPILSAKPKASERVRNDSATLFSNPE